MNCFHVEQNFVMDHKKKLQKATPINSEWIEPTHMTMDYSDDQEPKRCDYAALGLHSWQRKRELVLRRPEDEDQLKVLQNLYHEEILQQMIDHESKL